MMQATSINHQAHAVVMEHYGPPDVLHYIPVSLAPNSAGELRIKTLFAAVNHTDLEIRAGNWPIKKASPFPYVPGVEVVGVVDAVGNDVRDVHVGQTVITMMQGLAGVRADRPGGYADFVTVDARSVAIVMEGIDPIELAVLGLGAVTAHGALAKCGVLDGKRVLVAGATGGVGSAVTALARAAGGTVVGLASRANHVDEARRLGALEVAISPDALRPSSVDCVIDSVAGPLFGPCVNALRPNGILCLVGAVAGASVAFDAWQLIKLLTLTGYSTEEVNGVALQDAIGSICSLLRAKRIKIPKYVVMTLREAASAHNKLEKREISGRILLVPD